MNVGDFLNDPNWEEHLDEFYEWATSPEIENSGEARRQLGYEDGLRGEPLSSLNQDYIKGYNQGKQMRLSQLEVTKKETYYDQQRTSS